MNRFNIGFKSSIVQAPLPRCRDLLAAIYVKASNKDLAGPWLRHGEFAYFFSRSAWSLVAIVRSFMGLTKHESVNVWLPDFFCNSALAPLRKLGTNFVFYQLTTQLAPDLADCHRLSGQYRVDIFVLVHYFGQPTPSESVSTFCKQHQAWLVEDAVHVFLPVSGVGEFGDFVLYSPHKHLPLPDGAVMVVRINGPAQFSQNQGLGRVLAEVESHLFSQQGNEYQNSIRWLLKRLAQRLGVRSRKKTSSLKAQVNLSESSLYHPEMSLLAKRLLSPLLSRLQEVATLRKQNEKTWLSVLSCFDLEGYLKYRKTHTTPYLAGFSAGSIARTEALFNSMQQAGLPVTTWPDLHPEVLLGVESHPVAVSLCNTFFYLPVHQSVTHSQIVECGRSFSKLVTKDWQVKQLSLDVWNKYWNTCVQTNLLQSWEYGAAKEMAEGWLPYRLLICDGVNRPIALVQVLTKGLPFIGYIARINRGPVVLGELPESRRDVISLLVIRVLLKYAREHCWRIIQIAPEIRKFSHVENDGFLSLGFQRLDHKGWASGRLYLNRDDQALLMGLKGKWRNCMRKGERNGVIISMHTCEPDKLSLLIQSYLNLQGEKNFDGISEKLIRALSKQSGDLWSFDLFIAKESAPAIGGLNNELGFLVTIRTGDTAIYLISSTTDIGRKKQANSVLLWHSILYAKRSGCSWFDIGGLNENTTKGIADFKHGLNAVPYQNVDEFRQVQLINLWP